MVLNLGVQIGKHTSMKISRLSFWATSQVAATSVKGTYHLTVGHSIQFPTLPETLAEHKTRVETGRQHHHVDGQTLHSS